MRHHIDIFDKTLFFILFYCSFNIRNFINLLLDRSQSHLDRTGLGSSLKMTLGIGIGFQKKGTGTEDVEPHEHLSKF